MSNFFGLFFLGLLFLGALVALAWFLQVQIQTLRLPQDEPSQRLMLQILTDLRKEIESSQGKNRLEMEAKLNQMSLLLKEQHSSTSQTVQKQLAQSTAIIQDVTKSLTHLQETNQQVVGFAQQMKSLENILKNPKQRGILGEYFLETLLSNVLAPTHFKMQYPMPNGEIVDAAIFYNELIIPVDAKFSLEKYNQVMEENDKERREDLERAFKSDVKKRIDETAKYIRPEEGTTDFAFMFIPAEGVYYNLLVTNVGALNVNTENLIEYAFRKHVVLVSPSSFFAYLQTVIQGLKNVAYQEETRSIMKNIEQLGRHLNAYQEYLQRLGKHLGTAVNSYNLASREFKKVDKDVYKITDAAAGGHVDLDLLEDHPDGEEA